MKPRPTALIYSGAHVKAVQSIAGHSSAAFTLTRYGHLFDDDLDGIATRLQDVMERAQMGPGRDDSRVGLLQASVDLNA